MTARVTKSPSSRGASISLFDANGRKVGQLGVRMFDFSESFYKVATMTMAERVASVINEAAALVKLGENASNLAPGIMKLGEAPALSQPKTGTK